LVEVRARDVRKEIVRASHEPAHALVVRIESDGLEIGNRADVVDIAEPGGGEESPKGSSVGSDVGREGVAERHDPARTGFRNAIVRQRLR
jgi:hypothetical protein